MRPPFSTVELSSRYRVMAVAKAFGARRIIAIDVQPGRLEFAAQHLRVETHIASPVEKGEERGVYTRRHVSRPLHAESQAESR